MSYTGRNGPFCIEHNAVGRRIQGGRPSPLPANTLWYELSSVLSLFALEYVVSLDLKGIICDELPS